MSSEPPEPRPPSLVLLAQPPKPQLNSCLAAPAAFFPEPSGPEDGGLPRPTPPRPPLPCQVAHQQLSDLIMFGSLSVQGGKGRDQQANERMALQLLCHG